MNWVTTNIRLPEEDYMELRMMAARRRMSMGELMRRKLMVKRKGREKNDDFWKRVEKLAKKMSRKNPGLSLSRKLIEMRYEQ